MPSGFLARHRRLVNGLVFVAILVVAASLIVPFILCTREFKQAAL